MSIYPYFEFIKVQLGFTIVFNGIAGDAVLCRDFNTVSRIYVQGF